MSPPRPGSSIRWWLVALWCETAAGAFAVLYLAGQNPSAGWSSALVVLANWAVTELTRGDR